LDIILDKKKTLDDQQKREFIIRFLQ